MFWISSLHFLTFIDLHCIIFCDHMNCNENIYFPVKHIPAKP